MTAMKTIVNSYAALRSYTEERIPRKPIQVYLPARDFMIPSPGIQTSPGKLAERNICQNTQSLLWLETHGQWPVRH